MRPPLIESFQVRIVRARLKRPFITALGRKEATVNASIELRLAGGSRGYGEASGSLAFARLTPATLAASLRRLCRAALGRDARLAGWLITQAWEREAQASPAAAAFECALLEALAAWNGQTLAQWLGGKVRELESDLTLSASSPEAAGEAAREAQGEGFRVLKVKTSTSPAEDLERLRAIRLAHPAARLRLDGNQGMSESGAARVVETALKEGMPIELLEQPLRKDDFAGMRRLSRSLPIPVAADEMVQTPEDALRVASAGAARMINIKVAKSGLSRSLQIAAVARAAGLELMIGCMTETGAGLSASVALALGTGFFRYVDLDSDHLLAEPGRRGGWRRDGRFLRIG